MRAWEAGPRWPPARPCRPPPPPPPLPSFPAIPYAHPLPSLPVRGAAAQATPTALTCMRAAAGPWSPRRRFLARRLAPLFPDTLMLGLEIRDKVVEYVKQRIGEDEQSGRQLLLLLLPLARGRGCSGGQTPPPSPHVLGVPPHPAELPRSLSLYLSLGSLWQWP